MTELFSRVLTNLVERTEGPLHFRVILQPIMAGILAIRAARRDTRENRSSYLSDLGHRSVHQRELIRESWKDIARVFFFALILDVIYQLFELHTVYPFETVIVAIVLAIVPYLIIRAFAGWLFRKKRTVYE